jgi:thymidylate synthase
MKAYLDMMEYVLKYGQQQEDRTGTGTKGVFAYQLRHNLRDGFPVLTTKKLFLKGVIEELIWFIHGETDVSLLQKKKVKIWDGWNKDGDAGPIYGFQWRHFGARYFGLPGTPCKHIPTDGPWCVQCRTRCDPDGKTNYEGAGTDQLANLIDQMQNNPNSRRMMVSAWNPEQTDIMGLPACHYSFQVRVWDGPNGKTVDLIMTQRSCDLFLGVPFNIASYALLLHLLAHVCGYEVGDLIIHFGDLHIYNNHAEQCLEQLTRKPFPLPKLVLDPENELAGRGLEGLEAFTRKHFKLENYEYHPSIKGEVSV